MKKSLLTGILFIYSIPLLCQINFGSENILIDNYQMPSTNTEVFSSDMNNDGYKDLISTTLNEGYITLNPNILGDYTATNPKMILNNQSQYPTGVSAIDIDNDGLLDIIACNRFENKINWFKNLGNFTFSPIATLFTISNGPNLTTISDVDNDGIDDIVINLVNSNTVVWVKNNGDGTFMNSQNIYSSNNYSAIKIVSKDLNNDNFPEIIIGDNANYISYSINSGSGIFLTSTILGTAYSGKTFDFEDLNNDSYLDLIYCSNNNLITKLNQNGINFGNNISTSIGSNFVEIKLKDVDNDGITDVVGSTGTNISYVKRFSNGTFGNLQLLINSNPVTYFIADNLNGDNYTDFIVPSYNLNNNSNQKSLSEFIGGLNSFSQKLISFYNSAVFTLKIADIDNDGNNDIISSYKSVVWNKNNGSGNFSSYKKITNNLPFSTSFTYDIEITDLDNDNDKDVISTTQTGIEIYFNDGNGNFLLGNNISLPYTSRNIEVADLNGDNLADIVITFKLSGSSGEISLAWIPNLNGTTFGTLTTIGISAYGYRPYLITCTDMNNDGYIDIVSYSNDYSRIHLHTNNGNGIFNLSLIQNPISAICLAIEDFDNDGDKDIFTGNANSNTGIFLIKNNGTTFSSPTLVQLTKAEDIKFADLNGDGYKELIGTATESSILGTLFYLVNNGTSFNNRILINSENSFSSIRNIALGDLNNDSKTDIAQSFYYVNKTSFFINSTNLSLNDIQIDDELILYPIPFANVLNWKTQHNLEEFYDVEIYNLDGKLIYCQNEISSKSINLDFLSSGTYIFNLKSILSKKISKKIIKK